MSKLTRLTSSDWEKAKDFLQARWDGAVRSPVGDLEEGALILHRVVDEFDPEVADYSIFLLVKKNKDHVLLCDLPGEEMVFHSNTGYVLKNVEMVVHLVNFSNDQGVYE